MPTMLLVSYRHGIFNTQGSLADMRWVHRAENSRAPNGKARTQRAEQASSIPSANEGDREIPG